MMHSYRFVVSWVRDAEAYPDDLLFIMVTSGQQKPREAGTVVTSGWNVAYVLRI